MRPTVLLFDIDGTLISTGGAGRRSLQESFVRRFSKADALAFPFDGMTDHAIVTQGLRNLGLSASEIATELHETLAFYLTVLQEITAQWPTFTVHPGIADALEESCGRAGFAVGLGTGNVEAGARIKLERVNLFHRFRFGGYGSDHILRPELIRCGAERGAAVLGSPLAECRVVVIGDTPRDISAAQAIGAECLAVGTGSFDAATLRGHGATFAFENLAAPGALAALLTGHAS